jgi:glutamate--cysteine ligase
MTTVFTDVRLKRFLEMRGADAGTPGDDGRRSRRSGSGCSYDDAALEAAAALVRKHDWQRASSPCAAQVPAPAVAHALAGRHTARSRRARWWRSPPTGCKRARRGATPRARRRIGCTRRLFKKS